jgi:TonB family protein
MSLAPMRAHARIVRLGGALAITVASVHASAQTPAKDEPAPQGGAGSSIPHGASGAVVVTKEDPNAPPTPPPPVAVTPPILKQDDGAAYPAEMLANAPRETVAVSLVLVVDPTGKVTRADIEKGSGFEPFDRAAVEAAKRLVFEPAKRNGQGIAAKVRHKYEFAPPKSRIIGKVFDGTSRTRPLSRATLTLRAAGGQEKAVTSAADGTFRIEDIEAGKYKLVVTAEGHEAQEYDEDIEPGTERDMRIDTKRTGEAPKPGEADAGALAVEEVTVKGEKPPREVTKRTLEQREMSRIPGTNGDALRSLQNLPGVARPPGFAGLLIIRGSAPQDTNVFVDGALIPLVYHFGGLSSVIPTEMLEKIDFYPGNFSAQYGRVMGGIVDVGVRDPKKDGKIHGLAQVDLIDARLLAEGPVFDTGWNFLVGGRRSYVDVWLKPVLTASGAGVSTAPVYYDYQAVLQKDISKTQNFRVFLFGSDDRLDILIKSVNASEPSLAGGISAHTGFWRLQGRYKNKFTDTTELKIMGAVGQDFLDFTIGDNFFKLTSEVITSRVELSQKLAQGLILNTGLDLLYQPYRIDVRLPAPPRPGEPPSGPLFSRPPLNAADTDAIYRPAMYSELELVPWKGGRIVPGMRVDYAKDTRSWDVSPRFSARQDLTQSPRTTLKGGVGVFAQPPQPQETNPVFGKVGLVSNRALHYGLGVEREVSRNVEVSFEGFYKQLDHLVTPTAGNIGTGRAFGLETLLRYKPDERFFGWLAYTLSRSVRRDSPSEPERLARFDQTHILTVLGSYRLGGGWEIGARYRLVSGSLYTPNQYGFYDENAGANLPLQQYPSFGSRLPLFHQLDVRVDKIWKFKRWALSAYLDVQNVYNQGNVEGVSYNYDYTRSTFATGLPFLPSLGIRGEL